MAKARLEELYNTKLRAELQKKLEIKNITDVPKISKVVLNVGVKEAVGDSRVLKKVAEMLANIAGQKTVQTIAKKSIAGFKIREGMPLGVMVTLRRKKMYEFLDRLISIALPNVRDFRGVGIKFDRKGNYNLGIKEWSVFPEADDTSGDKAFGLNVTICTTTDDDKHAAALLEGFDMPFRNRTQKNKK
jgi:large subunit ribosomal protein L5